jgi:hypothetical protein
MLLKVERRCRHPALSRTRGREGSGIVRCRLVEHEAAFCYFLVFIYSAMIGLAMR